MKIQYIGIPTSVEFRNEMIRLVPFAYTEYANIYSHHITLVFAPNQEQIDETNFGKAYQYTASVIYRTPELVVAPIQSLLIENDYISQRRLHVTLATASGIPPVRSNDVLNGNTGGAYEIHDGSQKIFTGRICGFSGDGKVIREF